MLPAGQPALVGLAYGGKQFFVGDAAPVDKKKLPVSSWLADLGPCRQAVHMYGMMRPVKGNQGIRNKLRPDNLQAFRQGLSWQKAQYLAPVVHKGKGHIRPCQGKAGKPFLAVPDFSGHAAQKLKACRHIGKQVPYFHDRSLMQRRRLYAPDNPELHIYGPGLVLPGQKACHRAAGNRGHAWKRLPAEAV